jgi:branched-chain amino acid transport system ATP-binding protein
MAVLLDVRDLSKSFGGVVAAVNLNVQVEERETIGVIGANGAGKTTFVNMVTGYLEPTAGEIRFMGRSILGLKPRAITRLGICRSFQVPQVFASETVFANMLMAYGVAETSGLALLQMMHNEARERRVAEHLERYRIAEYRDVVAAALPQGVRKLLDIAMATVRRPRLIMLDEPTSGISIDEKFGIMDIIMEALRQERTTVLFIEHDMEIVERYVSRVLAFYQGEIICDAPTAEALKDPKVKEFVIGEEYHRTRVDEGAGGAGESAHA